MAAARRAQKEVGGQRATRAKEPPDAVVGRIVEMGRRSPKLSRGSPFPSTEDIVQAHDDDMHTSFEH